MKTVTISDVAKHAEVSKSTISQYLNKRYDYMAEKTKQRIEAAIEDLGYQPNIVARSLKQKSTTTIGVIVANILHEFSTQVIRAIEDVCHELDFHIIVCNADDDPTKEKKYIDMLRAKQVDGLIIFPTGDNVALYKRMISINYPVIFVDRSVPDVPVPSIMLDNEMASKVAVEHFIEKGYRRIGIVTTSIIKNVSPRVERINGYKKALKEKGLPVVPEYIQSLEIDQIQTGLKQMFESADPPEAILAGNDLALIEILKYTKEHQIKTPESLALIGIDDVSFASFYSPSLTTIAQPTFEMGKKAAELLLEKIQKRDDEHTQHVHRFEPTLIERSSC
ncbi:LacI family DNA-binding transcriptional regulator [Alkalihalobacillus sp. AL-G]|uniref:LacI family DNA-binding transcriptional regulator n=1 Tax=Alkalihalobacillus sp. AL-G TaxID=2926399 RepID=UPI00272C08CF|nr:substrate-binding domain-containing protein [Alkalihalobacillus sp. AL-G]WLD93338.1 substrate-binding domain-containing protein [Alkalihalobacillus sp. AL-G]